MIIKGTSRSGPAGLAKHLGNAETNERIELLETRGTIAEDLRGALIEMDTYAMGTRCQKPLYHAAISPEPPHRLSAEQRNQAVDALERKMGFDGHARVVVLHEKEGREHLHVVWTRIDIHHMRAVSDSHNFRKHEQVSRALEAEWGHARIQGAHHERSGVERPDRTPSRAELRQEDRTGIKGKDVKAEVSVAFQASDGAESFRAALADKGYVLAHGDRRDFVIVDYAGGIHSLARRIEGVKAAELREFMAPIDRASIPTISEVKSLLRERSGKEIGNELAGDDDTMRRLREAKAEFAAGDEYRRGGDYVSQSLAAQADFERRQERLRQMEQDRQRQAAAAEVTKPAPAEEITPSRELSENEQNALDRLRAAKLDAPDVSRGLGQQNGAPGAGHTRSR
ncbi:MAG: relaxase/mobilization nuclease domain-containing protein [Phenylobacterium sp.]|uniref:relaxase/mobilization nuclease domain-containing protein n=1 Tax=Phenylobacterium sp. TaxID=1871053 RepID=UPI001A5E9C3A|nr:relaxase/mobilization nuclease domain-containing protein [Phenylobacterium sp.]MBL8554607.1 relaxase/mobilization nuclease domain-containing protein [Phenylobacterium sp.]